MMTELQFDWDLAKNAINFKKHKVSFDEASTVFLDENALLIDDPDHSDEGDWFVLLGLSSSLHLLPVCHCYRSEEGLIRLISARKADRVESQDYLGRFKPSDNTATFPMPGLTHILGYSSGKSPCGSMSPRWPISSHFRKKWSSPTRP